MGPCNRAGKLILSKTNPLHIISLLSSSLSFHFLNLSSMEALGTISPLTSLSYYDRQQSLKLLGSSHFLNFSKVPSTQFRLHCKGSKVVRMQVVEEEIELKQMKDMAAAKKRWDALIRDGKVKVLTPREAGYAIQLSNKTLLDVRPSIEHKKAWVKGSTWVPIFEADTGFDVTTLSRNISNFMMGGWWSGIPSLSYNSQFLPNVVDKFEKDTDLIVACQKGLRSIAACELLYNYGYRNLFWVQGGLEFAEEEDLEREGPQPFKFAGIGGVSEFLGWTDQQRAAAAKQGWGYKLVYSARLVSIVLVADAMFIGAQQIGHYLQVLRPN